MKIFFKTKGFVYLVLVPLVAWSAALYTIRNFADLTKQDPRQPTDFLAQMVGAEIVRGGDIRNLYDYSTQRYYQQKVLGGDFIPNLLAFRTPPTTAYFYSLLPISNKVLSFWVVVFVNSVCILASIWLLTKRSFSKTSIIGTIAVFSAPLLMSLLGAQPTGVIMLLMTLSFYSLKDRPFLAGVLMSLLFIKPNLLLAAPFLGILARNKRQFLMYLLGFVSSLILLIAVNTAIYGKGFLTEYLSFLAASEKTASGTSIANNTNLAVVVYTFCSWLGRGYNATASFVTTLFANLLSLLIFFQIRRGHPREYIFALMCFILPVLNLHTMYPDLVLQLVALTVFLPKFFEEKKWAAAIWLLLVIVEFPYYSMANLEWLVALIIIVTTVWLFRLLDNKTRVDTKLPLVTENR